MSSNSALLNSRDKVTLFIPYSTHSFIEKLLKIFKDELPTISKSSVYFLRNFKLDKFEITNPFILYFFIMCFGEILGPFL